VKSPTFTLSNKKAMTRFRAAVGYDCGLDEMITDKSQVFDTEQEAEDWVQFMMDMDSQYDVAEVEPVTEIN
jgi:hypothetical protein